MKPFKTQFQDGIRPQSAHYLTDNFVNYAKKFYNIQTFKSIFWLTDVRQIDTTSIILAEDKSFHLFIGGERHTTTNLLVLTSLDSLILYCKYSLPRLQNKLS
jgi:hypothetical protein